MINASDHRTFKETMTIREEFSKFVQSTSVKGVSRLFKANSSEIKVLWALAVTTCFAFGFFQTYKLFEDFFSYATVTQIKRHRLNASDPKAAALPNIQVCNSNPSGMLINVHPNETFSVYREMVGQENYMLQVF